jgi:drug/metabolite transporter (DMT)-like permease
MSDAKTVALTLLALVAFASNSLLTRLALGTHQIDAAGFTAIRLGAGAVMLVALVVGQTRSWSAMKGSSAAGPLALFAYAAPFSFAYLRIGAAVGALVLFGVVQLTMIGYGIARGERPSAMMWLGLVLAAAGLALLTVPSVTRPDPLGVLLMAIAGVAWAVYTLVGRGTPDPLAANARSFLWSAPLAIALVVLVIAMRGDAPPSGRGIVLALVSGAVTSGLGYAIWYRALPSLTVTQAAVAQLSVPVIAALGAVAVLGEAVSSRLVVAGAMVLSGVGLVLSARARQPRPQS